MQNVGARQITLAGAPTAGYFAARLIVQAGGGAVPAWTWAANIKWSGGAVPSLTPTAGKVDVFDFWTLDAGNNWYGTIGGLSL
jgi:hypothetical protein